MGISTGSKQWALVIDDDEDLNEMLRDHLTSLDYKVICANKIIEAKNKIKNQKFDVIFVDLKLGSENGETLVDFIREEKAGFNNQSPIVVMSGFLEAEVIQRLAKKTSFIIAKPFDLKLLNERLQSFKKPT